MPQDSATERYYQIALSHVNGIGIKRAMALLEAHGTAEEVFRQSLKSLKTIPGISAAVAQAFKDEDILRVAAKEVAFIEKHDIQPIFFTDKEYPPRLQQCSDKPILLFYKGNAKLDAKKHVAIIGTRKPTDYGQRLTEELVEGLQNQEDLVVFSGLAYGIDVLAHRKCVKVGLPNVGVLAHGLDRIYPPTHAGVAREMLENGGLLTEFPSDTNPDRTNFPIRNRIVAGMSDVTVVVESDAKGGAMITAYIAASYNREVGAFPGRIYDAKSSGPNKLIKKNIAAAILGPEDLLEMMNWDGGKKKAPQQKQLFINLSPDEEAILAVLNSKDIVHSDEILNTTGLRPSMLSSTLLSLEMQGLVKTLPGKMYRVS